MYFLCLVILRSQFFVLCVGSCVQRTRTYTLFVVAVLIRKSNFAVEAETKVDVSYLFNLLIYIFIHSFIFMFYV